MDSLHNIYPLPVKNEYPIQLQLPVFPIHEYIVIQAGTTTLEGNEKLHSIDLHITLYNNSKGEIVYLYAGDTESSEVLITIPKVVKNPILPIPDPKRNNITIPSNTLWPSFIELVFTDKIANIFIQDSLGNVYKDFKNQKLYFSHELNSKIHATPVYDDKNDRLNIKSDTIKNMNYINLFFYVNQDCYCITFYNDDDKIITITSNSSTNITLSITYSGQSNTMLNKKTTLYGDGGQNQYGQPCTETSYGCLTPLQIDSYEANGLWPV